MIIKYINYIFEKIKNFLFVFFLLKDYFIFKKRNDNRFKINIRNFYPCILDKTLKTGFDRHYIYHTAWAARKVKEIYPILHIDISSSLYFSTIISAFIPVEFYDYRPAELNLSNFLSKKADLLSLPFESESVSSLSCMHVIEHVGLGRYGEPINPQGDLQAIRELKRVLSINGYLLFVVPIGKPKLQFNAHRIYSFDQIQEYFSDLTLKEFSLIPQYEKDGGIIKNASKERANREKYACGCFLFQKLNKL